MTITEINELTVEQVESILLSRLGVESTTQEELEAELELYKAELILAEEARVAEEARLAAEAARLAEIARKQDLEDRFAALSDHGIIQGASGICNPAAYFRDEILRETNHESAEQKLAALETAYAQYVQDYIIPAKEQAKRAERDAALAATDWTMIADSPLSSADKALYRDYRQYLRDIPQNADDYGWDVMSFSEWKTSNNL